jgi:hypothetical protein
MVDETTKIIGGVAHRTGRQLACVVACSIIHLGLTITLYEMQSTRELFAFNRHETDQPKTPEC